MPEGVLARPEGELWYEIGGATGRLPLVVLHGGPGAGHEYVATLARMRDERPVLLYDQLGCGRSAPGAARTIDGFVGELEALRAHLGLERLLLYGHSWGGFLALEYALAHPGRVAGLVLASTAASGADVAASQQRLLDALRATRQRAVRDTTGSGPHDAHPDLVGTREFYRRHVCRLRPWPDVLHRSGENQAASRVYADMNGPDEFRMTGRLRHWSRRADLGRIAAPTWVTAGLHDQLGPECWEPLVRDIPDTVAMLFGQSSHVPHLEEEALYLAALRGAFAARGF